jgi:putative membrane protein
LRSGNDAALHIQRKRRDALMMPGGGMMGWGGYGYGMGIFGGLVMLVFWGLIIVGVVLLVRWAWDPGRGAGHERGAETPLDIVKRRYARGEITKEEYDRIRQDLA